MYILHVTIRINRRRIKKSLKMCGRKEGRKGSCSATALYLKYSLLKSLGSLTTTMRQTWLSRLKTTEAGFQNKENGKSFKWLLHGNCSYFVSEVITKKMGDLDLAHPWHHWNSCFARFHQLAFPACWMSWKEMIFSLNFLQLEL